MLYHLIYPLSQTEFYSFLNIFKYISTRAFFALLISFLASLVLGKIFIRHMQSMQVGQVVRDDGPENHYVKRGTPTMGGVFIFGSTFVALLLCGNYNSPQFVMVFLSYVLFAAIGYIDDYLKLKRQNSNGLSGKRKLFWQFAASFLVLSLLQRAEVLDTNLYVPFFKNFSYDLGAAFLFFGAIVLVGSSNAVNLTDGLDGLAIVPIMIASIALGVLAYIKGHIELAQYLYFPFLKDVGEVAIVCAAIVGTGLGFLWYNCHPAQVFMGDVGSLSLGAVLGVMAVVIKAELLYILIGGVFVIEALSVILQVASFKLTGKRIFKMAPIHHHFELLGWNESQVIVRFWIFSFVLTILALATLKIR